MLFLFQNSSIDGDFKFSYNSYNKKHIAYCFAHHTGKIGYYAIQQERI